ncbi:MAG: carbon monoxide dehydrogenase subunit G [Chloroflexota bacterium]|nr:carbon monoxide dehydrogenase subunit G [Chloroflexota bacterium]
MHLEGSYIFSAPREAVWEAIMDPEVMGQALPGGEKMERTSESEYLGVMNVRVGPVQGKFQGKVELGEVNPPESCTITVSGRGAPGFISGTGAWQLEEDGDSTIMHYVGDVDVGGKIANVGQRLMESTAKSITRQGLESLDAQIQARLAPPAPAAAPEAAASETAPPPPRQAPPPPSTARIAMETTKDVASDLASDYIPAEQQKNLLFFGLGALSMWLFVLLVQSVQKR